MGIVEAIKLFLQLLLEFLGWEKKKPERDLDREITQIEAEANRCLEAGDLPGLQAARGKLDALKKEIDARH